MLLLSTHSLPIGFSLIYPAPKVSRHQCTIRHQIPTSFILLEFTTYMQRVDFADQLRSSYIAQTRSYKWRYKVFNGLYDISTINMYILYLNRCRGGRNPITLPLTHLQFKQKLCKELLCGWIYCDEASTKLMLQRPTCHMLSTARDNIRRHCVVCRVAQPRTY